MNRLSALALAGTLALAAACGSEPTAATAPPPAPRRTTTTLHVSIGGPRTVPTGSYCLWESWATGGTPPYSYSWSAIDTPPGSLDTYQAYAPSYDTYFTIYLTVTDAVGAVASTSKVVRAASYGATDECIQA